MLDLLAHCKIDATESDSSPIRDMGLWHSTPLARRHKSKVSLTWVLKENLENSHPRTAKTDLVNYQTDLNLNRCDVNSFVTERYRKCKRVVGRNENYHNLRDRNEEVVSGLDLSDSSEELSRRRRKHRHRRKKKPRERFGYDIKDLDGFLTAVSFC